MNMKAIKQLTAVPNIPPTKHVPKPTVYVAGPFADRETARSARGMLQLAGYTVQSRWLDVSPLSPEDPGYRAYMQEQAEADFSDLLQADVLFYINSMLSEGKATELGLAMATLKPIIVIGKPERNIFLFLGEFPFFDTIPDAISYMDMELRKLEVRDGVKFVVDAAAREALS